MKKRENKSNPKPFDELLFPYLNVRPVFPDKKAIDEALAHLDNAQEERALVIVGALLLEKAIDALLSAYVPGYESLNEERDFTFSMKIKLAKAVNICPVELLHCVNTVRDVRNAFAHELSVLNLSKILKKNKDLAVTLRQRMREYVGFDDGYETVAFRAFVRILVEQFYYYRLQAWLINEFIRSEELLPALNDFCNKHDVDLNRLAGK